MDPSTAKNIIILGGGIIGLSTAYYLLTSNSLPSDITVTLVERTAIAHGASSRAAGIIASAWHASDVIPLAELSWECYEQLNEAFDGAKRWDWRETKIWGVDVGTKKAVRSAYRKLPVGRRSDDQGSWLNGEKYDLTGQGGTAAM